MQPSKLLNRHTAGVDVSVEPFLSRFSPKMAVPYGPNKSFYRETLHERLKKLLEPFENDRVLEVGLSSRNSVYFSHRGPKWAELGHHEEVI